MLKRGQNSAHSSAGRLALAATANARPTRIETLKPSPATIATMIASTPRPSAAIRADADLLALARGPAADDVRPQVVRHRPGRRDHESRDDREDRREGDRADDGQEDVAADRAGAAAKLLHQQRDGEVAARAGLLGAAPEDRPRPTPMTMIIT